MCSRVAVLFASMSQKESQPHPIRCSDAEILGLAKRLLGYSVWLLGSGLGSGWQRAITITPKASCQYEWYKPTPTPLWHSEWKIFLCEFWLLRCSTMVARAWPVSVEVIQDWLLAAPETNEPTLMFLWHFYPEISLWSLSMEVYGTCC